MLCKKEVLQVQEASCLRVLQGEWEGKKTGVEEPETFPEAPEEKENPVEEGTGNSRRVQRSS